MKEEYLKLNDGSRMPRLGMGTWYLGENKAARKQEIEALSRNSCWMQFD